MTLGIARNTVVAAYDLLVAEGYVLPRRGAEAIAALGVVLAVAALAIPNIAANVDDGISGAGWLVAGLSAAQAVFILVVLLGPWTRSEVSS